MNIFERVTAPLFRQEPVNEAEIQAEAISNFLEKNYSVLDQDIILNNLVQSQIEKRTLSIAEKEQEVTELKNSLTSLKKFLGLG